MFDPVEPQASGTSHGEAPHFMEEKADVGRGPLEQRQRLGLAGSYWRSFGAPCPAGVGDGLTIPFRRGCSSYPPRYTWFRCLAYREDNSSVGYSEDSGWFPPGARLGGQVANAQGPGLALGLQAGVFRGRLWGGAGSVISLRLSPDGPGE